ncbi:MAG TPA: ATPase, T2SS/T4P/T4SS family, partial [Chitinolyticbacter sp.]|nr:ATPase, T2SS/T4P/T4SS family [Chitinolyticbacter sp.]
MSRLVPYHYARDRGVVDLAHGEAGVEVLMKRGADLAALAELRRAAGKPLNVAMVEPAEYDARVSALFSDGERASATVVDDIEGDIDLSRLAQDIPEIEDLMEAADDAPIIRLINALLTEALRENASDLHIEPFETRSVVRFRVDGQLRDVIEPKRALHAALVSRIKVM